ncbi:MAG: TAXI family TRAP transporter solute-binding subunit [Synergistales bacterium]|nr:TAXI family TRAP transporter solute-binding subunit [Synergistales bacterium]
MKKLLLIVLALVLITACITPALASKEEWPEQLRFMAGPPGGNWFALGGALADMWTKTVQQTTSGTGGGVSNVINTNNTKGDMGFSVTALVGAAAKGEEPFKSPADNAAVLANLYRQYTYFIMRKDYAEKNGVTSLGDIIDKKLPVRFATLKPGTASEFTIRSIFEKGFGVGWKDIKDWGGSVEFASYSDGKNLLADNHLDCFAFAVGRVASIVMEIETQTDVVILPVDDQARQKMTESLGTVTFEIMPETYNSVNEPVPTVGDYTCVVVRKDLPEDLVYSLAKAMWENKATLASAVKDMEELNPEEAVPAGAPAHAGAVKFWKEAK